MMLEKLKFYIDGKWVDPVEPRTMDVVNPATEAVYGRISLGSAADVDKAVAAASRAFESFSQTTREERVDLLRSILDEFKKRYNDVAEAIMDEMGAPWELAKGAQAGSGPQHIKAAIRTLESYEFEEKSGTTLIVREPIGVCGLITPWNWPVNQVVVKVAPAIAAGCTMVLKPSEIAPFDAIVFAEILDAAGVPAGVFNLVNGDGPGVGSAIASHPDVAMVSFTGSTRAGVAVAQNAAPTVKRVAQELGGKSANILLDDADFAKAVAGGAEDCFDNTGQSCDAPTRMHGRSGRNRCRCGAGDRRRRPAERGDTGRAGRVRDSVAQGPGLDPGRHRRGRHARRRRNRSPGRNRKRLFRETNRFRECQQ